MPSLERFFDPQIRKFDLNIKSLPGARFYFFQNGTTTPRTVYQDKAGTIPHANPVIADSSGSFPPIFLDGLYRVELRSNANIVQPGWPIDNVGQDSAVVPFGPYSAIVTYNEGEVVTGSNGNWYRSIGNGNLGNDPTTSPAEWEVIPIPVASSFTSDKAYFTWSDDGDQISLDVDIDGLTDDVAAVLDLGTASAIDYEAEQVTLVGVGPYTTGSMTFSRIGTLVTITTGSALLHPSADSTTIGPGFVPSQYRPTSTVRLCSTADRGAGFLQNVVIDTGGAIAVEYMDFSGAAVSRTITAGYSLSFNRAV